MAKGNVEISDYERQRQENIAKNKALLQQLQLDAAASGIGPKKASRPPQTAGQKRKRTQEKVKKEVVPTRTSSRIRGIVADSEVAQQKAEEERQVYIEQEKAKRQRVSGDLNLGDVVVKGDGNWNMSGNFLRRFGPAQPGERTFDAQDVKETTNKQLKELRERMSGLQLWEDIEPARIKITPERIYSMGFHPAAEKPLVFAGDKLGNLGVFDGSQSIANIKAEDYEEVDPAEIQVSSFKIHSRTISAFQCHPTDPTALFSASYDSSIRKLDLNKGVAVEVWAPPNLEMDEPLSGVEISRSDPNMMYFTSLEGRFGMHDMRVPSSKSQTLMQLSEKKIGGFSIHPVHNHFVVTASLDRCLKLWDLRKISGKGEDRLPALVGEHESKLSVSHAAFNSAGQVATASYDDTVKIYDFSTAGSWKPGHELSEEEMKPKTVVPHNNQTGRWVTILRAQWQMQPQDGVQRFCIGNMNRFVDVYTSKGEQLAQLGGDGISAVPAVAQFHPTQDWIAAGTASGKLCLWV
ncbi:hypothetical protein CAC42_6875 [Sphaceloma murrayae]|uniref:DNA damage-binding protein CMR1 n=1 Tax=Sphaceloma murrayae TaxID=2082308 RepID=A0A2K1QHJ9_9PEZI|nr:hypothetical protein CAC42_6875 [Sphaceloma murrayae]